VQPRHDGSHGAGAACNGGTQTHTGARRNNGQPTAVSQARCLSSVPFLAALQWPCGGLGGDKGRDRGLRATCGSTAHKAGAREGVVLKLVGLRTGAAPRLPRTCELRAPLQQRVTAWPCCFAWRPRSVAGGAKASSRLNRPVHHTKAHTKRDPGERVVAVAGGGGGGGCARPLHTHAPALAASGVGRCTARTALGGCTPAAPRAHTVSAQPWAAHSSAATDAAFTPGSASSAMHSAMVNTLATLPRAGHEGTVKPRPRRAGVEAAEAATVDVEAQ
jgi:hypothetical protein